jgi:glycerophosphoryl diester phosphodiesterase
MNIPIFIAHRGESYDAPENTLEAVNLAWERNDDAVEVDIRITGDNKIAVIHDSNTKRVSGTYFKVASQSLNSLKKLDVGIYKDNKYAGSRIPSLSEVLDTVPENKIIFIEFKGRYNILDQLKLNIQKSRLKPDQVKIMGFDFNTLKKARIIFKNYEIFYLRKFGVEYTPFFNLNHNKIIEAVLNNKFNGINIRYSKYLNKYFIKKIHEKGLKIFVWTVNSIESSENLIKLEVDGITSDRPFWLKKQLSL